MKRAFRVVYKVLYLMKFLKKIIPVRFMTETFKNWQQKLLR